MTSRMRDSHLVFMIVPSRGRVGASACLFLKMVLFVAVTGYYDNRLRQAILILQTGTCQGFFKAGGTLARFRPHPARPQLLPERPRPSEEYSTQRNELRKTEAGLDGIKN